MQTRFILVEPSHAGNVGAVARAMRVMGFDDLVLVAPRWPDVLTREEARQRASGATDVLDKARVAATLDDALAGVDHLCATAMTPRDFGPPTRTPRAHFGLLLNQEHHGKEIRGSKADFASDNGEITTPAPRRVGFLFGSERHGLSNEAVWRCHVALSIPTAPGYGSLNLAAAVQVIAYEWRLALGGFEVTSPSSGDAPADAAAVAGLLAHWQQVLVQIGFLDPAAPKKLMPRLNQLLNRAALTQQEVHILRGIARAVQAPAAPPAPSSGPSSAPSSAPAASPAASPAGSQATR